MTDSLTVLQDTLPMVNELQSAISTSIHEAMNTQFFQGGAMLAILGAVGYFLKDTFFWIWDRLERQIKYTAYLDDSGYWTYVSFNRWLSVNYPNKYRNIEVKIDEKSDLVRVNDAKRGEMLMNIHRRFDLKKTQFQDLIWIWYDRRLIFISKDRQTLENASSKDTRHMNSYTIWGLFAKKAITKILDEVLDARHALYEEDEKIGLQIRYNSGSDWIDKVLKQSKSLDNIYFQGKEELIRDLDNFKANTDHYHSLGLNNKRGYCFEGPPGTGKSAISLAIAKYLNRSIYYLNLGDLEDDGDLTYLISEIKDNSILVFEDIDTFTTSRFGDNPDKTTVNFTTLLQNLGGVFEPADCIIIMTTNHFEALDSALVRSGRIDKVIKFGYPTWENVLDFMRAFYKTKEVTKTFTGVKLHETLHVSMADVQNVCLQNATDSSKAFFEIRKINNK